MFAKVFTGVSIASGWVLWSYLIYLAARWIQVHDGTETPPVGVVMLVVLVGVGIAVAVIALLVTCIMDLMKASR